MGSGALDRKGVRDLRRCLILAGGCEELEHGAGALNRLERGGIARRGGGLWTRQCAALSVAGSRVPR